MEASKTTALPLFQIYILNLKKPQHIGPFTIFHGSAEDKHMEKISYSVDLVSLQCLCFYSPCHSQLKNFLFHGNKQKVHNSQGSKAGSLQLEGFPLFNGTRGEKSMMGLLWKLLQSEVADLDIFITSES